LSLKGGLKLGYTIGFSPAANAQRILSSATAKYLGVILDPRQSYWDHILAISGKSSYLYSRLTQPIGMGQATARAIYKGVFLPRITYAAEMRGKSALLEKSRRKLISAQKAPLLAITGAYRSSSSNCLPAIAGTFPLVEIRHAALKRQFAKQLITPEELRSHVDGLVDEWQSYDISEKGSWTQKMIPSIRHRLGLPLVLDHYNTQFLTGHGDFRAKLCSLKLIDDLICACDRRPKTVNHVLRFCPRTRTARIKLIKTLKKEGVSWPPENGAFLKSKNTFNALRTFAKATLTNRTDR